MIERAQATASGLPIENGTALPFGEHDVAVRVRAAHARGARGPCATARSSWATTRALGLGRGVPEGLHQPAGARLRLPRRGARRDRAAARGPSSSPFSVEPSPWLRPWAIALEAVLAVALATLFLRARERALRRRAEGLEALVGPAHAPALRGERPARGAERDRPAHRPRQPARARSPRRGRVAAARARGRQPRVRDARRRPLQGLQRLARPPRGRRVPAPGRRRRCGASRKRPGDLVARYGGEEFACLLVGLEREQAQPHAERLRAAIEELALPHPASAVVSRRDGQPGRLLGRARAHRRLARRARGGRCRALSREAERTQPGRDSHHNSLHVPSLVVRRRRSRWRIPADGLEPGSAPPVAPRKEHTQVFHGQKLRRPVLLAAREGHARGREVPRGRERLHSRRRARTSSPSARRSTRSCSAASSRPT